MKNNKLLAEYLGWYIKHSTFDGDGYWSTIDECDAYECNVKKWHPNSDWNQLMQVVEKIMRDYKNPIKFQDFVYNVCVEHLTNKGKQ